MVSGVTYPDQTGIFGLQVPITVDMLTSVLLMDLGIFTYSMNGMNLSCIETLFRSKVTISRNLLLEASHI